MSWSLSLETDTKNLRRDAEAKAAEVLKTAEEREQLSTALDAAVVIVRELIVANDRPDRFSLSLSGHVAGAANSGTHDKGSIHVSVNEL